MNQEAAKHRLEERGHRMSIPKRLAALEVIYRPADHTEMSALDRQWYLELCASSLYTVLRWFAGYLAERRYSSHHKTGATGVSAGDWLQTTWEADRDVLIRAELERLVAMLPEFEDDDAALREWLRIADRDGWPALLNLPFAMTLAGFQDVLTAERHQKDVARGKDIPIMAQWRRDHPAWRPGLDGAEAAALDHAFAEEAERLYEEWFGAEAA
jgi:hypothetical protein